MPLEPPAPLLPDTKTEAADELRRLKGTSDKQVQRGSSAVAGMSPEEEEGRRRGHRDRRRAAWAEVESWAIRAAGVIGILLAACFAILTLCIFIRWLGILFRSPEKVDALVRGAVWTVVVVLATWGLNNVFRREE